METRIDEKLMDAYTLGDCWVLASEFLRLGYSVVMVAFERETGGWIHAANRLPDGRIIDIEGVWNVDEWLDRWENTITNNERRRLGNLVAVDWRDWEFRNLVLDAEDAIAIYPSSANVREHAQILLEKQGLNEMEMFSLALG